MSVKMQPTNSHILNPNPGPLSFTVGDWNDYENFYAAIPCGKMLAVCTRVRFSNNVGPHNLP